MIFPGTSAERREGKKEAFMAENKKFVITVGRQYGSGGAEMAKRLGERLDFMFTINGDLKDDLRGERDLRELFPPCR